jgi:protocatechuate 3,4-dioxygenase beta subunit/thiol-disulfide isomerase/thioredoxin
MALQGGGTFAQSDDRQKVILQGIVVGEDDKPVVGATVKNVGWRETSEPVRTDALGRFEVPADVGQSGWIYAGCYAQTDDGRIGFVSVEQQKPELLRIVVKTAREVTISVQDGQGQRVPDAPVHFLADMRVLAQGKTNAEGRFTCRAPADLKNWGLYAYKSKVGFDYATSDRGRNSLAVSHPLPELVTLKLDGARTVRFKAIDQNNKPVSGVRIGPWTIHKPGAEAEINLSGTAATWPATDESGVTLIDWLPERFEQALSFINRVEGYYSTNHSAYMLADKPVEELTFNLLPLVSLSGRVTHADGSAAAGAEVAVRGQGTNHATFHGATKTDAQGCYQLKVYSEQAYLVMASLPPLISPVRDGILVRIDRPASGVDLVLGPSTRVHGRVTVGSVERPVPKPKTYLSAVIDRGSITKELPRAADDRTYYGLSMHFHAQTDAEGNYEFLLGPGEYRLSGPARSEPVKLTIPETDAPTEIVQDFHMPRPETGPLAGRVVDQSGKPVPGAKVEGRYASDHARRWFGETKCDEQGAFRIERSLDPLVIHAMSADGQLAGVARSDVEATEVQIVVGPVTTATGRLKDLEGKTLAGKVLNYGIRIYMGEPQRSPFSDSFGGSITTDEKGEFKLAGLVPGEEYQLSVKIDVHSSRNVTQVTAPSANPLALGELSVDPNPTKPYVPPTPAERTVQAFTAKRDIAPEERLKNLLAEAKREYTRPLLLLGTPADPACIDLYRLFEARDAVGDEDPPAKPDYVAPSHLRWEFELAALDIEQPEVRAFARARQIDLPAGTPLLAVLDSEGKLVETQPLVLKDEQLDPRLIGGWMARHQLPTRNAVQMYDAAIAKAKAEDKRVFFILSASWCGPCRKLAAFLAPHKEELEKHFVFVKFDVSRDEQADELQERFPDSQRSGVPWFCILNTEGKVLVTSNLPKVNPQYGTSNMGFPTLPAEVEHFAGLLKIGAPRLADEKLQEYKAELLKKK